MSMKRKKESRGRPLSPERMTPIGMFLYKHLEAKNISIATLARLLRMEHQESMVRRLFYGPTKKFLQIDRATLIKLLRMSFKEEKEFYSLAEVEEITFGVVKPISIIKLPDTLEWAEHRESDLIYHLQKGEAEYAMKEAIWSYNKIKYDERLPQEDKDTIKWLLRYGKLIEQAQETALSWHSDRAHHAILTLRQLENDISDRRGWTEGFYPESARLLARKASLWRETYRDDDRKNERNLWVSNSYYEKAIALLDTTKDPIFEVVLHCQRLHVLAIQGNEQWVEEINRLHRSINENPRLSRTQKAERGAIINYFKSMGYKRFAWALRNNTDRASVKKRNFCIQLARILIQELNGSEYRLSAWHAENHYGMSLADSDKALERQTALLSDTQAILLLSISAIETDVWFNPEGILSDSFRATSLAREFYPSAVVKIMNTQRFARSLIEKG